MLFNSYIFLLIYLPIVFFGFFAIGSKFGKKSSMSFLVWASLLFYGYWNLSFLWFIGFSLIANYIIGLQYHKDIAIKSSLLRKTILLLSLCLNIGLLVYFKYADFFINSFNHLYHSSFNLTNVIMPLAISFFTFEQIAFQVDTYRSHAPKYSFYEYCFFVVFFPQLIAGPIAHHSEILPQYKNLDCTKPDYNKVATGLSIFFIGLAKKTFIADAMAVYANPVFERALHQYAEFSFFDAWCGVFAYSFQLYFDFSAYSDMAIGLGLLFGIKLPLNFFSPYKANSIIDFWYRWHMTLSRFLREYLYIPLGGNRKGKIRKYINLLLTMFIGGLWHGAGWNFALWGLCHGVALVINHGWNFIFKKHRLIGGRLITFLFVSILWVMFRAESFDAAKQIYEIMFGAKGIRIPSQFLSIIPQSSDFYPLIASHIVTSAYYKGLPEISMFALCIFIIWVCPNTYQIMQKFAPALDTYVGKNKPTSIIKWQWKPNMINALIITIIGYIAIISMSRISPFLYFQF